MKRNKTLIRVALIVSFLGMNALLLFGISSVWSYLNTGADRSKNLHISTAHNLRYTPEIEWDTIQAKGRPMEKETLAKIERDYLNGWYVKNNALQRNTTAGLADYFTDSAQAKIHKLIEFNKTEGSSFEQTSLEHHPQLKFYSSDGTQVMFTDNKVRVHRKSLLNDEVIFEQTTVASYKVIMLLEDGFWRVRHFMKTLEPAPVEKGNSVSKKNKGITAIKGVNYYPKSSPWDTFGEKYTDSIISSDFAKIKNMGLNTVRIFIPYEDFRAAEVHQEKLQNVVSLLDRAEENNLRVMITLFDFYGNYDISDWTLNHQHAKTIVMRLKNHKALLAWDIKNEPDLDFDSRGKENVLAWLKELKHQLTKWDASHPVTVGWSSTKAAVNLADELDFVSFHYYLQPDKFIESYEALKNTVPVSKPLVLQEYGMSSYGGFWKGFIGSEEKQASYYKEMQPILSKENIPYVFWTLYDFEEVPKAVVGSLPWRKKPQQYYGCLNRNGKEKASFKILSRSD